MTADFRDEPSRRCPDARGVHMKVGRARSTAIGEDTGRGAGSTRDSARSFQPAALLAAAVAVGTPVALAALRVRRMRRAAGAAPTLHLDLDLDGTEPLRTITVLGDSAMAGFRLTDPEQSGARRVARALHLRDGRATRMRSVARNGATTADVLTDQVDAVTGADIVLLGIGANDAIRRVPTSILAADLVLLVERVRAVAAPGSVLVLVGCPDLSVAPGLPRAARLLLRSHLRRVARVQGRVAGELGVALVALPRGDLGPEVFADDGFHPGTLGHERIAAQVLALL
jgi:lysophospholipase L1-like esterase